MQQKRSVNFDDWKQAYKDGFDGFVLQCGAETGKGYIDEFTQLAEVKNAFYRSDGVHVTFNREKVKAVEVENKKFDMELLKIIGALVVVILAIVFFVLLFITPKSPDQTPIIEQPKTVIVQNNIIPRECYMVPAKMDIGFSIMIISVDNPEARFYIEVEDYEAFFQEYISKK